MRVFGLKAQPTIWMATSAGIRRSCLTNRNSGSHGRQHFVAKLGLGQQSTLWCHWWAKNSCHTDNSGFNLGTQITLHSVTTFPTGTIHSFSRTHPVLRETILALLPKAPSSHVSEETNYKKNPTNMLWPLPPLVWQHKPQQEDQNDFCGILLFIYVSDFISF